MPHRQRREFESDIRAAISKKSELSKGETLMTDQTKHLLQGVSVQNRFANEIWLSLAVIAIIVILPVADAKDVTRKVLPFALGEIPANWFYFVSSLVLSVLGIAFCAAHAQAIRADQLAHKEIDRIAPSRTTNTEPDPRDVFDATTTPSLDRVAPLAQVLRFKWQFYPDAYDCPAWLCLVTAIFYLCLKVLAGAVYYLLPGGAVLVAVLGFFSAPAPFISWILKLVVLVFAVAGGIALLIELVLQYSIVWKTFRRISKPPEKPKVTALEGAKRRREIRMK
jgi:hypothetical protein